MEIIIEMDLKNLDFRLTMEIFDKKVFRFVMKIISGQIST